VVSVVTGDVDGAVDVVETVRVVEDGITDDDVTVVDCAAVDVVVVFEQALSASEATNSRLNPTQKNFLFTLLSFFIYIYITEFEKLITRIWHPLPCLKTPNGIKFGFIIFLFWNQQRAPSLNAASLLYRNVPRRLLTWGP
jgi:hypothetical protein